MSDAPTAYRQRLARVIVAALSEEEEIRAVGEGGAAARGRADDYSDLDLVIVAPLTLAASLECEINELLATFSTDGQQPNEAGIAFSVAAPAGRPSP